MTPGCIESVEVGLGGVNDVPDDVAHLPLGARGRCRPGLWYSSQREEAFGLISHHAQNRVLALIRHGVPTHCLLQLLSLPPSDTVFV
jgi:hypothetical protein